MVKLFPVGPDGPCTFPRQLIFVGLKPGGRRPAAPERCPRSAAPAWVAVCARHNPCSGTAPRCSLTAARPRCCEHAAPPPPPGFCDDWASRAYRVACARPGRGGGCRGARGGRAPARACKSGLGAGGVIRRGVAPAGPGGPGLAVPRTRFSAQAGRGGRVGVCARVEGGQGDVGGAAAWARLLAARTGQCCSPGALIATARMCDPQVLRLARLARVVV